MNSAKGRIRSRGLSAQKYAATCVKSSFRSFFRRSLYRLYCHSLSYIPGPKLVAEIEKMHKKYDPIVRINPREVHVSNSYFYGEVYTGGPRRREQDPKMTALFPSPSAAVETVDHDLHCGRRNILNPFFLKGAIRAMSPYSSADVITSYLYGENYGFLDTPDFQNSILEGVEEVGNAAHWIRFMPWLGAVLANAPRAILRRLRPGMCGIYDLQDKVTGHLCAQERSRRTIFDALTDESVPIAERSQQRLQDEALILLGAGTETTSNTLTMALFHLLSQPEKLAKLREELNQAGDLSLPAIDKLPYLIGVVFEALRLSHGILMRLPRVAPTEVIKYQGYAIPMNTPVSMSNYFVHMDPTIFPSPETFLPERWLLPEEDRVRLSKYLVAFSKGTRACVGMNLAYAEIFTTIAALVQHFDMELRDTSFENVRVVRNLEVPRPKEGRWSVKVRITGVRLG
ncbi:cytochrome P450 [Aspergillus stella-maris]|uniref:cytochrome P450 n=1 Tax=Aspergillus stella-maris TaxID=1810926 RepID=UPI003CCCF291